MHVKFKHRLFAVEGAAGTAGGASPATTAPATAAPVAEEPPVSERASLIARITQSFSVAGGKIDVAALQSQLTEMRAKASASELALSELRAENARLKKENLLLNEDFAKIAAALGGAGDAGKLSADHVEGVVGQKAASLVSSHGFDPSKLPAPTQSQAETLEDLEAQLEGCKDPKQAHSLTQKIIAITEK